MGILFVLFLYFIPTFVALLAESKRNGSVFILNLFLGWTIFGRFFALKIALYPNDKS